MGLRCILMVPGASEEKITSLEGFVPPTHYRSGLGNLTMLYLTLLWSTMIYLSTECSNAMSGWAVGWLDGNLQKTQI